MKSRLGMALVGAYLVIAAYLVATQGLFGESFIALILGLPWTLFLALVEFGGAEGALAYVLITIPIVINAILLYYAGVIIGKIMQRKAIGEEA